MPLPAFVIPALVGAGSSLLAKKKGLFNQPETQLTPDKEGFQLQTGQSLADFVQKYLSQYQPGKTYGGQFTAPISPYESRSLDILNTALDQPNISEITGLAGDQLKATLTGGYNPTTSPFYAALREATGQNVNEAIDASRRGAASRGSFFTSRSLGDENRIRTEGTNYVNQILGQLFENERQRQIGAVPTALSFDQYIQGLPFQKAQYAQSLGGLPRLIEQSDLERQYQDFVRKQTELGGVPGIGQGVFGTGIQYGAKTAYGQSPAQQIMAAIGPILQAMAMAGGAGGGGAGGVPSGGGAGGLGFPR